MITEPWQMMVIVGECVILAVAPLLLILSNIETHKHQVAMLKEEAKRFGIKP
jgi:hypothetical protein